MRIKLNKVKHTPTNMDFNFCVYGEPSEEILEWVKYWDMKLVPSGNYTNIEIPRFVMFKYIFDTCEPYDYMDGFSPNLNKHLHVGHLSNLIMASALQNLGVAINPISILGDTMVGDVDEVDALISYKSMCSLFNYTLGHTYVASKMEYNGDKLIDGLGDYEGTKIFDLDGDKLVGVKSDGSTSYFYQDVALAEELNGSTLYLTGMEQDNHFKSIKKMYPNTNHLGLGLVNINGEKMSSRKGNVIMAKDLLHELNDCFDGRIEVAVNTIMGKILNYSPETLKKINLDTIYDPKHSEGLYVSYTMARLKSAGLQPIKTRKFSSRYLEYQHLVAKENLNPSILFKGLVSLCKDINNNYAKKQIRDNDKNKNFFQPKLDDLLLGMTLLGMYEVETV